MDVLVTGATGYIGGRLVPMLLEAGHRVRVLVRERDPVRGRPWEHEVEVVRGDLLAPETLGPAVVGMQAAYYLVHSMYGGADFAARDREAAENFVAAWRSRAAGRGGDETLGGSGDEGSDGSGDRGDFRGAEDPGGSTTSGAAATSGAAPISGGSGDSGGSVGGQVVYLGGLEPKGESTRSAHLRSRAEVGRLLAAGLPGRVTEFRAGPIIGSGSASFEMVRYLTERIPVMVTPKWVETRVQPIAVRDVLAYLEGVLGVGPSGVVEIGTEALTFKEMMLGVAAERGHRRLIVPLPVLAPKLAARWVGLVTPIPNALAVPLVAGVTQDLLADTVKAERLFPAVEPIGYREAVRLALTKIERGEVETRWSSAVVSAAKNRAGSGGGEVATVIEDREGLARDQRTLATDVPAEFMFGAVCSIGGERGWHVYRWAWWLRGLVDAAMGGPGLRRGRRHPTQLLEGEALDWWRVDAVEPPPAEGEKGQGLLRLRAEMRVPGRAWLQWEVERCEGQTVVRQTALFEPRGLPGTLYWYALLPAHGLIFPALLRKLEAEGRRAWATAGDGAVQRAEPPAVPT
ncbi:MAG: DUF2867 domain-containing protein [Planctomycetota bacterium]